MTIVITLCANGCDIYTIKSLVMKTNKFWLFLFLVAFSCTSKPTTDANDEEQAIIDGGQSNVSDDVSQKNIVQVAIASPDHKTLVTALKAAEYVDALSNAGPFTVFAPTDEAFAKLPAGTVDDLVKTENKDKLRNILEYHVYVGVIRENMLKNGMSLNQVNGENVKIEMDNGKTKVNGANVLGVASTSNGIIYVIDQVLLPETE